MKTSKQHAQEIFYRIKEKKNADRNAKVRAVKAFSVTLLIACLFPAVYFSASAVRDKNQPLHFDPSAPVSETEESEREDGFILPQNRQSEIVSAF